MWPGGLFFQDNDIGHGDDVFDISGQPRSPDVDQNEHHGRQRRHDECRRRTTGDALHERGDMRVRNEP